LSEKFTERTAGIWIPLIFYVAGAAYMLTFWGIIDPAAYHLVVLSALSILIAVSLYFMSRWAFWLGLFSFPVFFLEFFMALMTSVNFVGWDPNIPTTIFHASLVTYLLLLTFCLFLLIDKRNTLKSDRILDRLYRPIGPAPKV